MFYANSMQIQLFHSLSLSLPQLLNVIFIFTSIYGGA